MHPVLGLLRYILYNLILNRIISGRWGPASGTSLLVPQNVNFMPANFVAPPSIPEDENQVTSQCPEFYAEDALMLSQVIYLAALVVNHQFYVDLGGYSPSFRNGIILSSYFCHTYCLILGQSITRGWGPAISALSSSPPQVNPMAADLGAIPAIPEAETLLHLDDPNSMLGTPCFSPGQFTLGFFGQF
ncbi:hypothetical protein DSO57_1005234 [Entomophthora muscae]|uniref:Uncharacterized protein n=1 Tax=Entomophthora muscae TaxID=34485 RepID=A0ACC2U6A8_9FUNG|nr:hypothetical protein DSO57_1005234 [Entomophthora muscae]